MRKLLFIDRDGTIITEPPSDYQIDHIDKLSFLPHAITCLSAIARELDYDLVMVTNQDGLGTESYREEDFWPLQNLLIRTLDSVGVTWHEIIIDRSFAADQSDDRKPNLGRVQHYLKGNYDLSDSFVIGDRLTDMVFAHRLGARGILLGRSEDSSDDHMADGTDLSPTIALETQEWESIYRYLKNLPRAVNHKRVTKETEIEVQLILDGSGETNISTGLSFFDHMLDQLGKHGGLDLTLSTRGDLNVDEHHTIEDTALALGEAIDQALGTKRGIERYGYSLPMDDCLATVSLDFGGRPWLVWNVNFTREMVGDMPTEMFHHFFKSFSDAAKCNLNIQAQGSNEHHKIESIFKAFARAIRRAVNRDMHKFDLPTTKGVL